MAFLRLRPLLVTFLFILFYGSGSLFVTSLSIMFISAIITFLCFTFKIQLDFDYLFVLFEKIRCWYFERHLPLHNDQHVGAGEGCDSTQRFSANLSTLKDLPRPIARKIKLITDDVIRDFVQSWYEKVGTNEKQFIEETKKALEMISVEGYKKICDMDIHSTAVGLINLLTKHVKIFNDCCNAVHSKYPGISQQDFEQCIIELYETRVTPHITSKNQGLELDFLRKITDMILFKLLPHNTFSCEGGRFMLREILAINGLYKLINLVSEDHFINQALIDIFEEPVPIEMLLKQWNDEEKKDLHDDDDDLSVEEQNESKQDSDGYESVTDEKNHSEDLSNATRGQSDSSMENLTDNIESRYVTPNHSTTELSSAEETYNAFDRVLRQNQLEARMPAPVYGSTMVKLYNENSDDNASKIKVKTGYPNDKIPDSSPSHDGVLTVGKRTNTKGMKKADTLDNQNLQEKQNDVGVVKKIDRSSESFAKIRRIKQRLKDSETDTDRNRKLSESWGYCPPSTSGFYRKRSYDKMNKRQDLFYEQFKARFHSFGGANTEQVSCLNMCNQKNETSDIRKLKKLSSDESVSCNRSKESENVGTDDTQDDDEILKIHSVPDRNVFYETAPNCPTCIEMTMLANPFENASPVVMDVSTNAKEHECGLSDPHLFYSENCLPTELTDEDDNESFISCDSESLTDLEISINAAESESTLLASTESLGSNGSYFKVINNLPDKLTSNSHALDGFDIVSLTGSETEFSSVNDYEDNAYLSDNEESDKAANKNHSLHHRAPSVTTFASVVDSSTHENESQKFATPFDKSLIHRKSRKLPSIFQKIKLPSTIRKSKLKLQRTFSNHKDSVSTDDEFTSVSPSNLSKGLMMKKEKRKRNDTEHTISSFDVLTSRFHETRKEIDTLSSFSGATDTDAESYGKAHVIGYNSANDHEMQRNEMTIDEMTELADELDEDFDESEIFEDAKSIFEISNISTAAVLTESTRFSEDETKNEQNAIKTDGIIPIFEGEVILPHPGKIPVSAWMYPMQMISIPTTEVAFEKGWEPGGNKYTLYNIHYDIRIWPEIYKRELLEASLNTSSCNDPHETLPLIREIKRRYREFMYLHNRLTHSQMSVYMKGVLRPNRRYAMPFGRMDPDVIAGRRKILESYLVSLVSRQEVCNSREFKEFLGAEGYGNASIIKPKLIKPKQMENKLVGNIRNALTGSKDVAEKGESSRYFIHGYDVPRMFGYSDTDAFDRHSLQWFSNFVDKQIDRDMHPEGQQSTNPTKSNHMIGQVEFFQKPKLLSSVKSNANKPESAADTEDELGPRLSGDGSESTDNARIALTTIDSPDRRFSVGIASLFSNELAARTRNETLSILDARKAAEEIPWPLTDAVMSFMCQALKGMNCWLTFENVQQAVLYSLGGILEWKISQLIGEIVAKERWMKYLADLHEVIWENGKLKEPAPKPNANEKLLIKEKAIEKFLEFLPGIVRVLIGTDEYEKWARELLHSLQYSKINRHVLYAAIEIIIVEFIPELQDGFSQYKLMSQTSNS